MSDTQIKISTDRREVTDQGSISNPDAEVSNGKPNLKKENVPPPIDPDSSSEFVSEPIRGPLVVGLEGGVALSTLSLFTGGDVGFGFRTPEGYGLRAVALLGVGVGLAGTNWYTGGRLSVNFISPEKGTAYGLFGQYTYLGGKGWYSDDAFKSHLVGGGLELSRRIDENGFGMAVAHLGYLHEVDGNSDEFFETPFFVPFFSAGVNFIGP